MGVLNPILGSGSSLLQTGINAFVQKRNIDLENANNMKLANMQYQRDIDMWNRANKYNSPEEQMKRYAAAGLNPNLIYGSGGSPGNTATSLPKYQAPTQRFDYMPVVNLPDMISKFQDLRIKNATIDNLKASNDATQSLTAIRLLQAADAKARNWFNFGNVDYSKFVKKSGTDTMYGRGLRKAVAGSELAETQNSILRSTADQIIRKINLENNLREVRKKNIEASTALHDVLTQYKTKETKWFEANMLMKAAAMAGMMLK